MTTRVEATSDTTLWLLLEDGASNMLFEATHGLWTAADGRSEVIAPLCGQSRAE